MMSPLAIAHAFGYGDPMITPADLSDPAVMLRLNAWTAQLYRDYEHILYQRRLRLRPVVLRIAPQSRAWGTWDPTLRSITLSTQLIENYRWDIVVEILKHEMAHQLAHEQLGADRPHGAAFTEACVRLGVAAWAQKASGALPPTLPHWRAQVPTAGEERLLKKVEKLLSLATSSNEHEAHLAMQRVQELYAKYNLTRLQSGEASGMVTLVISRGRKRVSRAESLIFSILVEHFSVRAIFGETFDAVALCSYRAVEVLGRKENVLMAEYVYHFLWQQVHGLWADYQHATGSAASGKTSYLYGVLTGFRDKLRQGQVDSQRRSTETLGAATCQALVRREDAALGEFVTSRYPRLGSRSWKGGLGDATSYEAGRRAGASLTLHKGVDAHPTKRGLLLRGRG